MAAGLVVALVLAVAAIAMLFDPNDYKQEVAQLVEERTGRSLVLEGDLTLSYFPWLAVETGAVRVGNAPSFGAEPFATVERAALRVKLMPLLERRVEIGTIELDGLTLNLARDADGNTNWDDLVARFAGDDAAPAREPAADGSATGANGDATAADAGAPAGQSAQAPAAQRLALGGLRVRNGAVRWHEGGELRVSVDDLAVTAGAIAAGAPVVAAVEGTVRDERSGLTVAGTVEGTAALGDGGRVEIDALESALTVTRPGGASHALAAAATRVTYDPAAATLAVAGLRARAAGAAVEGELTAASLDSAPSVRAQLALEAASLAELLAALDWPAPQGVSAEALGRVVARADLELDTEPRAVRLSGVAAELLGFSVRGAGELRDGRQLTGRLEIPEFATTSAVQALLRSAVPPTVDVGSFDRLALMTRFDADLDTGRAALRDLDLSVLGARVQGTLEAVPGENGNVYRGSVATSRFSAAPLMQAFRALLPEALDAGELGDVRVDTRFVFDTAADAVTFAPFAAELFGLEGAGEIRGTRISTAAEWTGRLEVAEFSPQALITRFGLPPQPTSDPQALTRARIDTRFVVTAERGRFENIVLALDDSRITGDFTVENFADPRYAFALAVDRVDADRYVPPRSDAVAGADERTAGDIELPEHNTMRLDGTMTVGALGLAGMQFAGVGARIVIGDGNLALENAHAELYGGRFDGSFRVRAAGDEPGLALVGQARDLDLAAIIEGLTGEAANVSGTGSFDIDLAGRGRKLSDNLGTAAGNVGFTMRAGTLRGFNLGRTLCAAWNLKDHAPAPPPQPEETRYESIQGTATVQNGVATTRDLLARTSFMDVTARGTLALVDQTLDYEADAKLTGKIDIPNCATLDDLVGESIPFTIKGPVTGPPTILPDFSELLRRYLREKAAESIRDRLLRGLFD